MHPIERWIARLLLAGVALGAALIVGGALLYLSRHGHDLITAAPSANAPRALARLFEGRLFSSGSALIEAGLFVLVVLPLVRVALTISLFVHMRNWSLAGIGVFVLAVLLYSVIALNA